VAQYRAEILTIFGVMTKTSVSSDKNVLLLALEYSGCYLNQGPLNK
jgi:hypothetical protein